MSDVSQRKTDSQAAILVGGLLVILFGLGAVLTAIEMGWAGTAMLGLVLLLVAWRVTPSPSARVLRFLMAGAGVLALLGAAFDLTTR